MRSGVGAKRRAVAAGMINRAETSRMPTIFIAKATATAISSMKTRPVNSADALGARQLLVDGQAQQRAPQDIRIASSTPPPP